MATKKIEDNTLFSILYTPIAKSKGCTVKLVSKQDDILLCDVSDIKPPSPCFVRDLIRKYLAGFND